MNVGNRAIVLVGCALVVPLLAARAGSPEIPADEAAIREVIERAYVEGLHVRGDETAVREGFHPDFVMTVHDGDGVIVVPLEMWLEHLELDGERNPEPIEARFERIDVTGNTAVVRLEIFEGGEHLYTDYFGLYKLTDGWKIVNKLFQEHVSTP